MGLPVGFPVFHGTYEPAPPFPPPKYIFGSLTPCPATSCGNRLKNPNFFLENGPPAVVAWRQKCTCVSLRRTAVNLDPKLPRSTSARDPGPLRGATFITKPPTMGLGKNPPEKTATDFDAVTRKRTFQKNHVLSTHTTILEKEQRNDPLAIHPSCFPLRHSSLVLRHFQSTNSCNAYTLARGNNSAEKTAFPPRKRGFARARTRKNLVFPQCSRGNKSRPTRKRRENTPFRDPLESHP